MQDMFNKFRHQMFTKYNDARSFFIKNPNCLINSEKYISDTITKILNDHMKDITKDFNETSYLYPFWANYQPLAWGRDPKHDQIPWIEVGEQTVGDKIKRVADDYFEKITDTGVPIGADHRFVVKSKKLLSLLQITDSVMIFLDTKTVGPRDDKDEVVASPYQVSGDGIWTEENKNVQNHLVLATGKKKTHDFYPAVSPLLVTSDNQVLPIIHIFIKPVYTMNNLNSKGTGQPIKEFKLITIPNGLLLTVNPNYLKQYPHLLYPGKDTKNKNLIKRRARINTDILKKIASWRFKIINPTNLIDE